jgi:hypothetical protein
MLERSLVRLESVVLSLSEKLAYRKQCYEKIEGKRRVNVRMSRTMNEEREN